MFYARVFWRGAVVLAISALAVGGTGGTAQAQDDGAESCTILCSPELALEPAVDFEPLTEGARTVTFENGQPVDTSRAGFETPFELTLAVGIPTQWSRVELGLDAAWTPFVDADENPFNGKQGSVTENPVELSGEISFTVLRMREGAVKVPCFSRDIWR